MKNIMYLVGAFIVLSGIGFAAAFIVLISLNAFDVDKTTWAAMFLGAMFAVAAMQIRRVRKLAYRLFEALGPHWPS